MRPTVWALISLLPVVVAVVPAGAREAGVETELLRADGAQHPDRVVYTWRGEVRNTRPSEALIKVRLVARDSRGKPVAYLEVPAVSVPGRGSVRQEAVFQLEKTLWRQVYTVDAEAVSEPGEESP